MRTLTGIALLALVLGTARGAAAQDYDDQNDAYDNGYAAQPGSAPDPNYASQPAGYAPDPNGYAQAPNGYAQAPNGYAQAPNGYAQAPSGYAADPNGYAQAPAGYGPDQSAPAAQDMNLQVFQNALSPYGEWIQTPDYGLVWRPAGVGAGWRPYSQGRWVWTAYGWTWVGAEPWAWAPYHYGRWVQIASLGWSWMPDYTWGPAWVSFRFGPSFVGWSPLPPGYAYGDNWYDQSYPDYGAWCFTSYGGFYPGSDVAQFNVYTSLYPASFVETNVWVNTQPAVVSSSDGCSYYGPTPGYVSVHAGTPVVPAAIHASASVPAGHAGFDGHSVQVVAPPFHGVPHPFGGADHVGPNQAIGVGNLLSNRALPPAAHGMPSLAGNRGVVAPHARPAPDSEFAPFPRSQAANRPVEPAPRQSFNAPSFARPEPQRTFESPRPSFNAPSFSRPAFQQPAARTYEAPRPSFNAPSYSRPTFQQPAARSFEAPRPSFSAPSFSRPAPQRTFEAPHPSFNSAPPRAAPVQAAPSRGNVFRHR